MMMLSSESGLISLLRGCACILLTVLLLTGCAATSTAIMDEEVVTNRKPMSFYKSLDIRTFELKRELFSDAADSDMSNRQLRYAHIPVELAEGIERYMRSHHTYQTISRNGKPSSTTLVLKGKFLRIGRFRISIEGTLHDGGDDHEVAFFRQTLWDIYDTTGAVNLLSREVADFIDRIQYK